MSWMLNVVNKDMSPKLVDNFRTHDFIYVKTVRNLMKRVVRHYQCKRCGQKTGITSSRLIRAYSCYIGSVQSDNSPYRNNCQEIIMNKVLQ